MAANVLGVSEVLPKAEFPEGRGEAPADTHLLYAPVRVGATEGSGESWAESIFPYEYS